MIEDSHVEQTSGLPLVVELSSVPDTMDCLRAFADCSGLVLLESKLNRDRMGRYSFLTADPFRVYKLDAAQYGDDPFGDLRRDLRQWTAPIVAGLPPFQGGMAGLAAYELGHAWERLPRSRFDEFELPVLAVGAYDWVIAWDHWQQKAWIIAHGFPATDIPARRTRAAWRLKWAGERIQNRASGPSHEETPTSAASMTVEPIQLAPQFPVAGHADITSTFSHEAYLAAVERVIEYIRAGDIFQANLSQRLLTRQLVDPLTLYERLRDRNPAPFAGYLAFDDWYLLSASPERFLRVQGRDVETRPIKGTRQRRPLPEADLFTRDELRESEKDQAENVMIVDLLRNDLSRVCAPGSIRVPQLCTVETYETVQHLVSEVRGTLRPDCDVWDLLRASFPGGSITGAPKVRAMEIISELEPTARGPYCGSLFYVGFDGQMDSNILIRTFTVRGGWVQFPMGGGIVAQSDPEDEFRETMHKAEGMLRALR